LRLYEWNADVSAALGATVGHLEVLLRNALHDQLTVWSTERFQESSWYLDPGGLMSIAAKGDIEAARRRAQRGGAETPGRIVAELNLGFWRFLLRAGTTAPSGGRVCIGRSLDRDREVLFTNVSSGYTRPGIGWLTTSRCLTGRWRSCASMRLRLLGGFVRSAGVGLPSIVACPIFSGSGLTVVRCGSSWLLRCRGGLGLVGRRCPRG